MIYETFPMIFLPKTYCVSLNITKYCKKCPYQNLRFLRLKYKKKQLKPPKLSKIK